MKIVIISDTHGDVGIIQDVKNEHAGADYYIHCGDSELAYDDINLKGFVCVRGNCDRDIQFPTEEIVDFGDERIYVTHGHLCQVKSTMMPLSMRAREVGATIALFGHTHVVAAEKVDGILYVNPGSLKKPRGRKEKSYIVLEGKNGHYDVSVYDERHERFLHVNFS